MYPTAPCVVSYKAYSTLVIRRSPQDFVEELEIVLDEDAQTFVVRGAYYFICTSDNNKTLCSDLFSRRCKKSRFPKPVVDMSTLRCGLSL